MPLRDNQHATLEGYGDVDLEAGADGVHQLLMALGIDTDAEGLRETPRRVAKAYAELLTPVPFEATTFPNEEGYDELVVARAIPFHSLCEHHLIPFVGVAHVAYLPGTGSSASPSSRASSSTSPAGCRSRSA